MNRTAKEHRVAQEEPAVTVSDDRIHDDVVVFALPLLCKPLLTVPYLGCSLGVIEILRHFSTLLEVQGL